ncbi:unnamed protein product [Cladocopium goreaui]|uniref:Laminin subunit beta-4 n=1 Tax=Cladocopium goreaui TaxID=2562237 RepID=A0A9P1BIB9_9DINO|nr:unnamed protein product [Cladocopium goreaui]
MKQNSQICKVNSELLRCYNASGHVQAIRTDLQSKLANAQEEARSAKETNHASEEACQKMEARASEKETAVADLQAKIEELKTALATAKSEAEELRQLAESKEVEKQTLAQAIATSKKEADDKETKLSQVEAQKTELERQLKEAKDEAAAYLHAQLSGSEASEKLQEKLAVLEADKVSLEKHVEDLKKEAETKEESLLQKAKASEAATAEIHAQLLSAKEEAASLQAQLSTTEVAKVELEKSLKEREEVVSSLRADAAKLGEEIQNIKLSEANKAEAESASQTAQVSALQAENRRLDALLQEANRQKEDIKKANSGLQEECQRLRVDNQGLEHDVVDLARMLTELKAAVHQPGLPVVNLEAHSRLIAGTPRYCYCCWQEDPKKQQQTVLDVSDERQRTVVHTENAMSEVKEEEDTPHTFMVKFRRKGPLSIDKTDIHNVVIKDVAGPLIDWNESQASEHQIRRYDRIVQVNGKKISGVDVDLHIEDKGRADVLLTLQRPVKRKLTLHRPGKLGVDLQYRKSSAKPWLTNITDGLVLQWNQENPSQIVTAHDRLVAVNSREELDGVIDEVRGPSPTLVLDVLHYGIGLH